MCLMGDPCLPPEDESILLVDTNRAITCEIALQMLEPIARWNPQIRLLTCGIENLQLSVERTGERRRYLAVANIMLIEALEPHIPEFHRHGSTFFPHSMHNHVVHQAVLP